MATRAQETLGWKNHKHLGITNSHLSGKPLVREQRIMEAEQPKQNVPGTWGHLVCVRRVRLGESRQFKLLLYCVPTADFKSIESEHCTGENTSVWLKIQDTGSVFSPWAEQQLSEEWGKKKKKLPSSQLICNGIPLDIVSFLFKMLCACLFRTWQESKVSIEPAFEYSANKVTNEFTKRHGKVTESRLHITYKKKTLYCLHDFCHRLRRPQVGWDQSLSATVIHICCTHL